ncbi:hypothetical protein BDB01DRAFT_729728 [Pilobolus umbonatus]|nr:hypothetical protein BDB01DRAFT_729728 [Pilobolus umbonatus]
MSQYEIVCEELDDLTISYLNKLSEYTQQWTETSREFQEGYMDLAHAKYTMGTTTVSRYSYDKRMKASLQV